MEVLHSENHGTLSSSSVDTSDTVEFGFLTAVTINLSFFLSKYDAVQRGTIRCPQG
jgi:hypothetical protein